MREPQMVQNSAVDGFGWRYGQSALPKVERQVGQNVDSVGENVLQMLQRFIASER